MSEFKKTERQIEQARLFSSPAKYILSYGGARASKTFGICRAIVVRACKTKSRHIALRLNFNHAKMSLWHESFPKVFSLCFPDLNYHENKTDHFYLLPNGSEIHVGGLDDAKRVEKILGKEYSSMFFNEVSQIPYSSYNLAVTRLAERNELTNKVFLDCNPPGKKHWTYPLFIKGLDPETWEPKKDADKYASILMNPRDNMDNIDPDFINMLENLPEKERLRFLEGEYADDSSGNIYYAFNRERHVKPVQRISTLPLIIGMDFNVNPMTAVICQIVDDKVHVLDEVYLENSNTDEMAKEINRRYPGRWQVIPDSTGKALKTSSAGLSDHQILKDHGFLIPFVQNPFRMDRYNEVNAMFEKDRIVIDPKSVKLIKDFEQVSFKEGTNLPDTRDKSLTHISDGLGYLVHWAFPMIKISSGISEVAR